MLLIKSILDKVPDGSELLVTIMLDSKVEFLLPLVSSE